MLHENLTAIYRPERLEGRGEATRTLVHIAKEIFPSPVALTYEAAETTTRLRVVREGPAIALGALGALGLLGLPEPPVSVALGMQGAPGTATFFDDAGEEITSVVLPAAGTTLRIPAQFAAEIELRDAKGVRCARGKQGDPALAKATCPKRATLGFVVHAEGHVPAPFHALIYGAGGTKDPVPSPDPSVATRPAANASVAVGTASNAAGLPAGSVVPPTISPVDSATAAATAAPPASASASAKVGGKLAPPATTGKTTGAPATAVAPTTAAPPATTAPPPATTTPPAQANPLDKLNKVQ